MKYTITDTKSGREFHFDGDLIASESTQRPGRARWSELQLYRTPTGQYVLVKTGASIMFHQTRECAGPHAKELKGARSDERVASGIPCPRCGAAALARVNGTRSFAENDLVTVIISKSAEGVVESAHIEDEDHVITLTYLARRLLENAGKRDEDIRKAYEVQVVA